MSTWAGHLWSPATAGEDSRATGVSLGYTGAEERSSLTKQDVAEKAPTSKGLSAYITGRESLFEVFSVAV